MSLRNNRKGSAIIEILISISFITFVLFFPVAMFSVTNRQTTMSTLLIHSLQIISLEGGLDENAKRLILENAEELGFNPIYVTVSATYAGTSLTNIRIPKGSRVPIEVTVRYPANAEARFMNDIARLIGSQEIMDEDGYYEVTGYVNSEWAEP